ncbi:MAG: gamma-butyrobetaine hydroxylase-like domain-containing protein, partial [Chthoniobacterales bacterium]
HRDRINDTECDDRQGTGEDDRPVRGRRQVDVLVAICLLFADDVLGRGDKPEVKHTPASFELSSYEMVGGYGWQPKWADGHNTGIFSVGYLRRLDPSAP